MVTATVVGNVWATRRLAEIPKGAFLEVEAEGTGSGWSPSTCWAAAWANGSWSRRARSPPPGSRASRRRSTR